MAVRLAKFFAQCGLTHRSNCPYDYRDNCYNRNGGCTDRFVWYGNPGCSSFAETIMENMWMTTTEIGAEIRAASDGLKPGMDAASFSTQTRALCELARAAVLRLSEQYEVDKHVGSELAQLMNDSYRKIQSVLPTVDSLDENENGLISHFANNIKARATDAEDLAAGKVFT